MPRRELPGEVPAPARASDAVIARCRAEVEAAPKRLVRRLLLPWIKRRHALAELGEGFQWPRRGRLVLAAGSRIGRYAYLGAGFSANGPIVVGDLCMISAECRIVGPDHRYDLPGTPMRLAFSRAPRRPTIFGFDVWVGSRVTILEGVTIGAGAVIGSGALVTRDVAPYTIVGGVPARHIRDRFEGDAAAAHERALREDAA